MVCRGQPSQWCSHVTFDENGEYTYLLSDDDQKYIGGALPWIMGGLSNTLSYGPVSFGGIFPVSSTETWHSIRIWYNMAQAGSIGQDNQTTRSALFLENTRTDHECSPSPIEGGRIPGHSRIPAVFHQTNFRRELYPAKNKSLKIITYPRPLLSKARIDEMNVFVQGLKPMDLFEIQWFGPRSKFYWRYLWYLSYRKTDNCRYQPYLF